jgi:hypothetical protein
MREQLLAAAGAEGTVATGSLSLAGRPAALPPWRLVLPLLAVLALARLADHGAPFIAARKLAR